MGGLLSKSKQPIVTIAKNDDVSEAANFKRAAALGEVLSKAGIDKVVMIRHANAKPRDHAAAEAEVAEVDGLKSHRGVLKPDTPFANSWTVGDLTRGLTPKGEEQAEKAREWLGTHQLRVVICSEATRAWKTKDIMVPDFPKGGPGCGPGCLTLHTLHPARSGTPDCEKMFDKLGYGTLDRYFADTSVEGCEGRGKQVFRHYMNKVTGELHALIKSGMADFGANGDTVAVFGHAVFLNAVAVAVAEALGIPMAEDQVAALELGEAQGILCDGQAQSVSLLGV